MDRHMRQLEHSEQGLIYVPDFIDPETCAELVRAFERNKHLVGKTPDNPFFAERFIWRESIPHDPVHPFMTTAAERIRLLLGEAYNDFATRLDSIQLCRWDVGQELTPHADNCEPDGSPNGSPQRTHSAVVYLNDDFDDGVTHFPRQDVYVQPKAGALIGFTAGRESTHGVHAVTRGVRYTMPAWFMR